jgi:hypothetical protein
VIYLEEAAFMALDVFFEVVVPLLEMETTALIAISTPLDGLNVSYFFLFFFQRQR